MKISDPYSEDLFSFNFNTISIFNSDTQKLLKEIKGLTRKKIKNFKKFDDIDKRKKHIPYIFTQTTLKPLFCVDMMEPFVQFSQEINKDCSILCVLGYAGNKDDVIVNSIRDCEVLSVNSVGCDKKY